MEEENRKKRGSQRVKEETLEKKVQEGRDREVTEKTRMKKGINHKEQYTRNTRQRKET